MVKYSTLSTIENKVLIFWLRSVLLKINNLQLVCPLKLIACRHLRCREQRQALGLATGAADFQIVEEKRRGYERGGQAALSGTKGAECGAGKAGNLALHVVVDEIVVANAAEVAQHACVQANDAGSADHLLAAVIRIDFVDYEWQAVARPGAAAEACQQFGEVILMEQADGGIVHFADDQAVRQFFRAAFVEEFFLQIRGRLRFRGIEKEVAHGGLGIVQE